MALPRDIRSCEDVDDGLLDQIFAPTSATLREDAVRLVERMARVAQPQNAHRILQVLARLAQCESLDGPIDVMVRDFGLATEIDVRVDVGRNFERLKTLSVAVPFEELTAWAGANADLLTPLAVFDTRRDDELRLRVVGPRSSRPRPSVEPSLPAPSPRPAPVSPRRPMAIARRNSTSPSPPSVGSAGQTPPRLGARVMVPGSSPATGAAVRAAVPASSGPPLSGPPRRPSKPPMSGPTSTRKNTPPVQTPRRDLQAAPTIAPPPAPAEKKKDPHRRDTLRLATVDIPEAAYRPPQPSSSPERHSTAKIPPVGPALQPTPTDADDTDEGWE